MGNVLSVYRGLPRRQRNYGYLGPAIEIENDTTNKILLPDGNYFCGSTVRAWTSVEEANPELMEECKQFMLRANHAVGRRYIIADFDASDLTPEFEYYADKDKDGVERIPDEILPPTPEAGDNYVGTKVQLPRGDEMAECRVHYAFP